MNPKYSLVIPFYNEEKVLPLLWEKLSPMLNQLDGEVEIIAIDDGSSDQSYEILRQLQTQDRRLKIIHFSRNFGHQIAITAGMDHTKGDAVIVMDGDLQDPPETILKMIEEWKKGYEVVYAIREARQGESFFKKFTAHVFYRLLSKLTDVNIPQDVGDFRLVDQKVILEFRKLKERHRFIRGMFSWIGFKQKGVYFQRDARAAGETKYPFRKMFSLAIDAILAFSDFPLKVAIITGLMCSLISVLFGVYALIGVVYGLVVPGWTSLVVAISFFSGIQLIVLGFTGSYIGRIYTEVKNRPLYVTREKIGFEKE